MRRAMIAATALRTVGVCAGLVLATVSRAEGPVIPQAAFPDLPLKAGSAEGFAPAGWIVEARCDIDLNRDGVPDVVFVLHQTSLGNLVSHPNGSTPLNTNPRMLVVAFAEPTALAFRRVVVDHTIIPRWVDPLLDDPFGEITAARGAFSVRLTFFSFAGTWEAVSTNLTFRHQSGGFELIGADREIIDRGSGKTRGVSANYSTGTLTATTGTIDSDFVKTTRRRLARPARLKIEQVGDGAAFQPR